MIDEIKKNILTLLQTIQLIYMNADNIKTQNS